MVNSKMPSIFYEITGKISQSHKEKSCLNNCISRMKFFENSTSEKTAKNTQCFDWLMAQKGSKLKNACTGHKIWRDNRKQLSNRNHITQKLNFDIFFAHPLQERLKKRKGWTDSS